MTFWQFENTIYTNKTRGSYLNEEVAKATWVFPKIGVPQNGWLMMENPIKFDGGTIIFGNTHIVWS